MSWEVKKLGEVCDFIGGGTPSKKESSYWNGKIAWTSIKDIKGMFLLETQDFISQTGLKNSASNIAKKNELIIATRINPGKPIISKIEVAINQDLKIVRPKLQTEVKYLYFAFQNYEKDLVKLSSGTTVLGIRLETLNQFKIPLPDLSTQKLIVSKIEELFSELDKGIEEIKRAKEQVKIYRQSVLKWAFEGKLTNEKVKDSELPEGWEWKKIGEIGKVKGGKRLPKGHTYSEQKSPFPYLRVTDFKNQSISKEKLKYLSEETQSAIKNYTISKNDVFISIAGTIGETGTIPEDLDGANLTENAAKITDLKNTFNKFLALYLSGNQAQFQIKEKTKTTTQPKLSLYRIEDIDIPLPHELKEQQLIVREIETRFSLADQLEKELENSLLQAEALRQSILKKAFEGELVN